ncbi:MAG: DUF1707 domain-containing protein [Solirubrobacteraceae bacterium]
MSEERRDDPPSTDGLRASDADRERLIEELNEHAAEGRLTTEELEERLTAAYAARTTGEIDALRGDLPATVKQVALHHRARRAQLTRRMIQETGGTAGAFVVCTAIWLASGAHGQFWPVWVLIVFALSVVRNGWALYGPSPDFDAVESHLDARRERRLERGRRRGGRR